MMKIEKWPEIDKWGRPMQKMPDCPECGEDELGLITSEYIMCYSCSFEAWQSTKIKGNHYDTQEKMAVNGVSLIH